MTKTSGTVVFFGSGPVAAASLALLLKHTTVEAVVTKPRLAHHRGKVPVLELTEQLGLQTFTPTSKKELSALFAKRPFRSKLGVVIDYGIIIAKDVIDYFPLGIINSHFSLLPEWRGADPITFAVLSGQDKTGVSLMLIDEGMDTGTIIAYGEEPLDDTITTPALTQRLITLSDSLLQNELPRHFAGQTKALPQEIAAPLLGRSPEPSYSRKLTKEDGVIDWSKPALQIEREIRAFLEWPKSRTRFGEIDVVITSAKVVKKQMTSAGSIHIEHNNLLIACGESTLQIERLKPAGKGEMSASAFLAGYRSRLLITS